MSKCLRFNRNVISKLGRCIGHPICVWRVVDLYLVFLCLYSPKIRFDYLLPSYWTAYCIEIDRSRLYFTVFVDIVMITPIALDDLSIISRLSE